MGQNDTSMTDVDVRIFRRVLLDSLTTTESKTVFQYWYDHLRKRFFSIGDQAFVVLTHQDPSAAVQYLIGGSSQNVSDPIRHGSYVVGSYFGWRCEHDREKYLTQLLVSDDPYIRVVGAVYLTFENRTEGIAALYKLSDLPGDPGAWAALTLARYGEKAAVPRLLKVCLTSDTEYDDWNHFLLQKRLMELFSNSAKKSSIDQPKPPHVFGLDDNESHLFEDEASARTAGWKLYHFYQRWWNEHANRITLIDPWLPALFDQKID